VIDPEGRYIVWKTGDPKIIQAYNDMRTTTAGIALIEYVKNSTFPVYLDKFERKEFKGPNNTITVTTGNTEYNTCDMSVYTLVYAGNRINTLATLAHELQHTAENIAKYADYGYGPYKSIDPNWLLKNYQKYFDPAQIGIFHENETLDVMEYIQTERRANRAGNIVATQFDLNYRSKTSYPSHYNYDPNPLGKYSK